MPEIQLTGGELDGLLLHYVEEGQGPAIVLIHGLGGFAESWRHNIPELSGHGRVIALDLPGFGRSGKPRRAYTTAFLAQALDGFLRTLGVDRVRLVGHSLGGAVAARYALEHPARVERLALLGAAVPGFDLHPSWVYRTLSLRGVGEVLASFLTRGICAKGLERCFAQPDPEEIRFFVEHEFAARTSLDGRAAYLSLLRTVREDFTVGAEAYRAALARLGQNVLVIHGREDRVVPMAHARRVVEGLGLTDPHWLDRCGHFPQIEHAGAVNARLKDFLFAPASR
ncbi:MAG TPA: alpha/beta fold hydrolase [Candidatus Eisenbacteria bacterium]|nr:alpha/beta fold hydrolase [Candidatus Eisenbacteria bacterium]